MADFGINIDLSHWLSAQSEMKEKTPKAIMWSMREAGRAIKAHGQGAVPVLTGALRASITASKNIQQSGDSYRMSVGPHGPVVSQYSGVQQGNHPYMDSSPGSSSIASHLEQAIRKAFGSFL